MNNRLPSTAGMPSVLIGDTLAAPLSVSPEAVQRVESAARARFASFVALTKPRIVLMVALTAATGYWLAARTRGWTPAFAFASALVGTSLVAAGASVWNQVIERDRDARMRRTASRPLPSGRLGVGEATWFGGLLAVLGVAVLFWGANPLAAFVASATLFLYVAVYTPLKPITTLNTVIGAIPGALPPVIGWAAAAGRVGVEAGALFLIVFLWQFPHFLAIAWIHRDDYARGGHRMLPSVDPTGALTSRQASLYALVLVPAGLLPAVLRTAGPIYFAGALVLGLYYLAQAVRFRRTRADSDARRLMRASFLYLPALLLLLILDPV